MKLNVINKATRCICIIMLLTISGQFSAAKPMSIPMVEDIEWYADLYPDNPGYVRITIDTRNLPANAVLQVDSIEIVCKTRNQRRVNTFTPANFGDQFSSLRAGEVYQGFFKHSCPSAKSIAGSLMHLHRGALGGRSGRSRIIEYEPLANRVKIDIADKEIKLRGEIPKPKHSKH